jgi:hypothetical protein
MLVGLAFAQRLDGRHEPDDLTDEELTAELARYVLKNPW